MIFSDINFNKNEPIYIQIKSYIEDLILKGLIPNKSKLPSTRELSQILGVSRNSVVLAYEELKSQNIIYSVNGKGTFVNSSNLLSSKPWTFNWNDNLNFYAKTANEFDIIKTEIPWKKDIISFKSISPQGELFDIDEFKKSFLSRLSLEGHKLLNYGYAQGYKPLIDYLIDYMSSKGVDTSNKDILITNGFTEGFDIVLSSFTTKGDNIICENPTHNTAIKIMKSHDLNIIGVDMDKDGINLDMLNNKLNNFSNIKFAYTIPSYHNPTGIVSKPEKRFEFYNLMKKHNIAIIEDGFNEELLYTSSHLCPIVSLDSQGNGVIYIGSFSKILFPGIRIGWIFADKKVIDILQSVKRCKNIHSSSLDQAILFDYLNSGAFNKYVKKIRKFYKDNYELAINCINKYIPSYSLEDDGVLGEGGLHIFLKLKNIDTRYLLNECSKKNVIFMPGDIFYVDNSGANTLRLGFSRLTHEEIELGIKIIGDTIKELESKKLGE